MTFALTQPCDSPAREKVIVLVDDLHEAHEIAGDMRRNGQHVNVRQLAQDGAIRPCEVARPPTGTSIDDL